MAAKKSLSSSGQSATASFGSAKQNAASIRRIVDRVLGMAGCPNCGRIARLKIDFLTNPPPEFGRDGVISFDSRGF